MTAGHDRLNAALADRYKIERELGAGGMATVYLADDLRHERKVAVKVLRPELAASIGPERFLREIRIAAQLQHPHILPLHESGEADGFLYYVMPYVDGESLRSRLIRSGELPVHEAVRLVIEVVDALAYAHGRGVVHRDIKPDNVMLSGRHALVMDFGVAKAVSEASGKHQLTTAGVALGTPAYMAPEQAAADPHLDHRVDIYAVGVMAYELLAGRPPFVGGSPQQVLAAHVTQAPEPLSKFRPGIAPALEAAIMRCLAKRPADRWQSAEELMGQLEVLVTPSSGMTPTDTRPIAVARPIRRWPWILGAAAVVLIVGTAVMLGMRRRPDSSLPPVARTQLTYSGRAIGSVPSPDGNYVLIGERQACAANANCPIDIVLQEVREQGSRRVLATVRGWSTMGWWSPDSRRFQIREDSAGKQHITVMSIIGEIVTRLSRPAIWAGGDTLLSWDRLLNVASPRWIVSSTLGGAASDSFALGPVSVLYEGWVSPNGRWIVLRYRPSGMFTEGSRFILVSRTGRIIDSLAKDYSMAGWGTASDRLYLTTMKGTQTEVVRQNVDLRSGRLKGSPLVLTQVPGTAVHVAGNTLTYSQTGPAQNEIWTLQRSSPNGTRFVTNRVYQTSAEGGAGLSGDGKTIYVNLVEQRDDSTAGRDYDMPFAGGRLTPSTDQPTRIVQSMWAWSSPDGTEDVIAERLGKQTQLSIINVKTGATRALGPAPSDSGYVWWLGNHFVWQTRSGTDFYLLDDHGRVESHFKWPADSLGSSGATPTTDGTALVINSYKTEGDSGINTLYRMSLPDWTIHRIAILPPHIEDWQPTSDGWVRLFQFQPGEEARLLKAPLSGGSIVDEGPVPVGGDWMRISYSEDGQRAVEQIYRQSADIVLMKNFDSVDRR